MTTTAKSLYQVTPENKKQWDNDGFFFTPVLFEPEFIQKVSAEFDRLWDYEMERTGGPFVDKQGKDEPGFMIHISQRSQIITDIFRHPAMLELAKGMLGADTDLNYDQLVIKKPSSSVGENAHYKFAFHQDHFYALKGQDGETWNEEIYMNPNGVFQCWMAFSDTTVENGTLYVMPQAHQHGLIDHKTDSPGGFDVALDPRIRHIEKVPALLKPGQAVVFSGFLPHGSGINVSDTTRKIIQFSVSLPGGRSPGFGRPMMREGKAVL